MKKYIVFTLIFSFLVAGGVVYAQNNNNINSIILRPQLKKSLLQKQTNVLREFKQDRQKIKNQIKNSRSLLKPQLKKQFLQKQTEILKRVKLDRQKIKNRIKDSRYSFKAQLNLKRKGLQKTLSSRRENLIQKLKAIRNKRKQTIVLRISDRLEAINTRATDRLGNSIQRINYVLNQVIARTNLAKEKGLDVSNVLNAINNASNSILDTKASIENQVSKIYTINVTQESTLRATIKAVRDNFISDIKTVREQVKSTQKEVKNTIKVLSSTIVIPTTPNKANTSVSANTTKTN